MKTHATQAPLFNARDLFAAQPVTAILDENETISALRRKNAHLENEVDALKRLHLLQEAERVRMAKLLGEKNETLIRQEAEIARLKRRAPSGNAGPASIPKDMWRRLLQLCHPDKHSNTDAATAATQWLNANKP